MKSTMKVGIIGAGGIAGSHARAYKMIPDVEIVAVADVVPGVAEQFVAKEELKRAKAYLDHRELLAEDLDAVSVCTPNATHARVSVDALEAGKHVLIEKPLAVTLAEALDMVAASRRTGRMLSVGFQPRYSRRVQAAKRVVDSGALGRIYYAETSHTRRKGIPGGSFIRKELAGGGVVLDIGCYALDMVMYLLGNPKPLTVSAFTANHLGTSHKWASSMASGYRGRFNPDEFAVEDFGGAMVRLEGDICLVLRAAWAMHMDALGPTILLGVDGGLKVGEDVRLYHDKDGEGVETRIDEGEGGRQDVFYLKVKAFVDAVREGKEAPIPAEEIIHSQAILDGIYRSAAAKEEVRIDL